MFRWLVFIGILFIIAGLITKFAPWLFDWFGKLPSDIFHDKGDTKIFFPITSILLISFVLTRIIHGFSL
ncbi:MAG: DUF2905 domain-containing protein [Flavobacteriaceae bacterium]|nr:DUF2905 domain-containing protein [Flavobacteriaceae bacterium]